MEIERDDGKDTGMNTALRKRVKDLEKMLKREVCFCLVELPDGMQKETALDEWYNHRKEWRFLRMTVAKDPAAVLLVLADVDDQVAEDALSKGDVAGAMRLTAEAARFLAEYERVMRYERP